MYINKPHIFRGAGLPVQIPLDAILGPGRAGLGSLFPEARHRYGLRLFNACVPSQAITGTWLCMVCGTVRDFRLLVFQLEEARLVWFCFGGILNKLVKSHYPNHKIALPP